MPLDCQRLWLKKLIFPHHEMSQFSHRPIKYKYVDTKYGPLRPEYECKIMLIWINLALRKDKEIVIGLTWIKYFCQESNSDTHKGKYMRLFLLALMRWNESCFILLWSNEMELVFGDVLYFAVIIMFSTHSYSVGSFHSFEDKRNLTYNKMWKQLATFIFISM